MTWRTRKVSFIVSSGSNVLKNLAATTQSSRESARVELNELNRDKYYIANDIVKDIVHNPDGINNTEFNEWVTKRGDIICEFQLADELLAKGEKVACDTKLNLILANLSQEENLLIRQELSDYANFKKIMVSISDDFGVVRGLDNPSHESAVRNVAENYIGQAKVQAQNLLCFFKGECQEPLIELEGLQQSIQLVSSEDNQLNVEIEDEGINVYPNPTDDAIWIDLTNLDQEGNVTFELFDLTGKQVQSKISDRGMTYMRVANLSEGIYVLKVRNGQEILATKKIVVKF